MNNLHIIFSFKNGGSENLLINLLNNWNFKEDKNFLVIINDVYDQELVNLIDKKKCVVYLLKRSEGGKRFHYVNMLREIIVGNEINNLHCHSVDAFYFSLIATIGLKVNLYLTIHNLTVYSKMRYFDILVQKLFLKKIIAITNAVKETVLKKGFPDKMVIVIYNGIDLLKFDKPKYEHNEFRILCPGRIVPEIKGQDVLLKALAVLKQNIQNFKCVFLGGDPIGKDNISSLKKMADDLGVSDFVEFAGNSYDVPGFMQDFQFVVVPSREEGFGLVVIEGMAANCVVIGSNVGGIPEIIRDGINGFLFESENITNLVEVLVKALSLDSDIKNSLMEQAFNDVSKMYNISTTVENYRKVYSDFRK